MRKILLAIFFSFVMSASVCAGIVSDAALRQPDVWQKNFPGGENVVLDEEQITAFNKEIIKTSATVHDLKNYPDKVAGASVKNWLAKADWLFSESVFVKGKLASPGYKQLIAAEQNIQGVTESVNVEYAVTICRVNLRALPTNEGWFTSASDTHFDQLQETALDPAEPVVIIHKSKSGNFAFVQMRNYLGWLPMWTLGLTDKKTWLTYADPEIFLMVVSDKISVKADGRENMFQMGAKIPVADFDDKGYTVLLPSRAKEDGRLINVKARLLNDDSKYSLGYLDYTKSNIIAQAFRFLDYPYGWGGLENSVDCSALIERVYRTVGVELPRNADEQELTAGVRFELEGMPNETREAMFAGVQPGDVLFMPGHTLLYLGKKDGQHYAIHALGSHYVNGQRNRVMKVVVSDLDLRVSNGNRHFEALTSVISYR